MILCPRKTTIINPSKYDGYSYREEGGVSVFFEPEFEKKLFSFLETFTQFREGRNERMSDPSIYDKLPYINTSGTWKVRQYDLAIIKELINSGSKEILDIGAWNGWLSQQLSNAEHSVTAIDYFNDELDGLKARKHYSNPQWKAIQMDLEELNVIEKKYDVIVVNRCIGYFTSIQKSIEEIKQLLKPKGQLIITGVSVFGNTKTIEEHFKKVRADYFEKYGTPMDFKPMKAYLDKTDLKTLKNLGIDIRKYPQQWKGNLAATVLTSRSKNYFGVYVNE